MRLAEHVHGSNGLGGVLLPTSPEKACWEKSFEKIYHRISTH
jgi:inosine-uridine nucleoside N-ribohydrolase